MSKDSYSPNKRVRESKQDGSVVKEFMTTPKVGETDKTEIKGRRPMPGVIILVHGVNDIGEAYPIQAKGLCEGLNIRLGRKDLTPGEWDTTKSCRDNRLASFERRAEAQGRNPIIPFYWGCRPVDKATYEADQARYREELRRRRDATEVDAPYDAYYIDGTANPRMGYENQDCFGNRLDEHFAKNGGVFANATTNLVDMWGPGGRIWGLVQWISNNFVDDLSHPIYDNPHRIYLVWAARRLANLILAIRRNKATRNDSITLIGHSQGTLVSMLANFLVASDDDGPARPADCLILNHSPYSLDTTCHEWAQSFGLQQSERARIETFKNLCQMIDSQKLVGPQIEQLIEKGIVNAQVRGEEGYLRDTHGKIFNYFCPHDKTVSLQNVEGFGWKGVPREVHKLCGDGLAQRMFVEGEYMHKQSYYVTLPDDVETGPSAKNAGVPAGEMRNLNAGKLPDLRYQFSLPSSCSTLSSSNWGIYAGAQGLKRNNFIKEVIDNPFDPVPKHLYTWPLLRSSDLKELDAILRDQGKDWKIRNASMSSDGKTLTVLRYPTREELYEQARDTETEDSYHSAIVRNEGASKNVTAFDVAIGRCNSYDFTKTDGGKFWQKLLRMADWRESDLDFDRDYYMNGLLPPDIKRQMNKPAVIPGILNESTAWDHYDRSAAIMRRELDALEQRRDSMSPYLYRQHKRSLERQLRHFEHAQRRQERERDNFPVAHQQDEAGE